MRIARIMWWNIISVVLTSARSNVDVARIKYSSSSSKILDVFPGFRLSIEDDELRIKFNLNDMFPVTAVQSRAHHKHEHQENDTKSPNKMQKFGSMMMMIPLIMQMLSIPVAIASIKMSLLKSIFVGKLAVILMLYNLVKNHQASKTIVIQVPAAHHDHFYPQVHEDANGDDKGWFGSWG